MTLLARPSQTTQRRLTRAMQLLLAGMITYGVVAPQPKAITNGAMALAITFTPAILERDYERPLDPWLGLWITTAVFLHTLGSSGLYGTIGWWDHLTHAISASLIAGVGYTVVRALDVHHEEIVIPDRFAFAYIVVVVLAFGVVWELFEFGLDLLAIETGVTMPLAQHGLGDTVRDLMFNSFGAIVVGLFGQAHLGDFAERMREEWFERR